MRALTRYRFSPSRDTSKRKPRHMAVAEACVRKPAAHLAQWLAVVSLLPRCSLSQTLAEACAAVDPLPSAEARPGRTRQQRALRILALCALACVAAAPILHAQGADSIHKMSLVEHAKFTYLPGMHANTLTYRATRACDGTA